MATPKTISFQTLGCKLNFSESSALAQQFEKRGYGVVDPGQGSDIFVLNTCSVTDFADKKCRKAVRHILKRNPDTKVVVTGCYAQLKPEEIAEIPGVCLVLGAAEKFRMIDFVEALEGYGESVEIHRETIGSATSFAPASSIGDRTRSFLKVQDGCDYKCSFCTIPRARGRSRCGTPEEIVASAHRLGAEDIKEIVLTGVNTGDYRQVNANGEEISFAGLIKELDNVQSVQRFRISSLEPNLCHDEIIDFVAGSDRFMPHLHMPLQSGNNKQLRAMRRRYKRELYAGRVAKIRAAMPHACIGVDVIVGFPGETDADFEETRQFVDSLDVSYLHVFTYSERPNTPAAEMDGVVPLNVRRERSAVLRDLSDAKRAAFYHRFTGTSRDVLLEQSKRPGTLEGYTDNYIRVAIPESDLTPNDLCFVALQEYHQKHRFMRGEVVSVHSP